MATDVDRRDAGEFFDIRSNLLGAQGAVDADAEQIGMSERIPNGLDRLCREGTAVFEDRERGHDGKADVVVVEIFFDGEQTRLEDERIKRGFGKQDVDAAFDEGFDLFVVGVDHLVKRGGAMAGVFDIAGDRKLLVGGADGAGDEAGLFGIASGIVVGGTAGQRDSGEIDFAHVVFQAEIGQSDAGCAEGVGFDNVGADFEIRAMDFLDGIGLGNAEDIDEIPQVFRMVSELGTAKLGFVELQGMDHGAHGTVEDENSPGEQLLHLFVGYWRFGDEGHGELAVKMAEIWLQKQGGERLRQREMRFFR